MKYTDKYWREQITKEHKLARTWILRCSLVSFLTGILTGILMMKVVS